MSARRNRNDKKAGRDIVEINVKGNQNAVATHGGKASVVISPAVREDWHVWREKIEAEIRSHKYLTAEDQEMLVNNAEQVVKEAEKGDKADPNRIERLINTISAMAPDILEVIITTIGNPLSGIGLVIKKIGDKAKVVHAA